MNMFNLKKLISNAALTILPVSIFGTAVLVSELAGATLPDTLNAGGRLCITG